ncbi:MAG: MFS transporter [Caulobacterales bacterium]
MSESQAGAPAGAVQKKQPNIGLVVAASSSGTVFEWYDFFIFGLMATTIAKHFFTGLNDTAALVAALLTFAIGLAVRPLGAVVFGAMGDSKGRKNTFLITISVMGLSTFAIGFMPDYNQIGIWAPIGLLALRILQGFALGGEYGGAVIYVAEHAPAGKRGYYTGWVQTAASIGLTTALLVILATRTIVGEDSFGAWGWRIPFLVSMILLAISLWIRTQLGESPVFTKMKEDGAQAKAPLSDIMKWPILKLMLLSLVGLMMAQGVIWYFAHFYTQTFLEGLLKVPGPVVNQWLMIAVLVSTPLYIFFAWLSDKIGRKPLVLFGMILAAISFFPGFHLMAEAANPDLARAQKNAPIIVYADPAECSLQFDPVGKAAFSSSCDIAKSQLASSGISYDNAAAPKGSLAEVHIGSSAKVASVEGRTLDKAALTAAKADFAQRLKSALKDAGYPEKADPSKINHGVAIAVFIVFIIAATALYGPLAMMMIELMPARVRYSAVSIPYNIGTGVFGGFVSPIAVATVAATGNIYSGAYFPVIVTVIAIVVCFFFMPETKDRPLGHEADQSAS